jgi:antitoxin (DNA-binding transcriptional repressor) of toxin-antitoxin stability system
MRRVGVRDFKDHATAYLNAGETLVIERYGEPVGFYVPVEAKDRKAGRAALDRLGAAVKDVLDRAGVSEDELVKEIAPAGRRRR